MNDKFRTLMQSVDDDLLEEAMEPISILSDELLVQQSNHVGFLGWKVVQTSLQGTDSNRSNA